MQQLIYETAVPVSSGRHAKVSVDGRDNYAFCRHINSAPLTVVEFPFAATDYAIVFAQNGDSVMPVVILGARKEENLFVADDGRWLAAYVPAFVRRYPFVFATNDDGKTFTLCVDEAYPGVNYLGKGQALFGAEGQPTPYVDNVLQFLQEYRLQFQRTQAFSAKVQELGLLEPMQAQFALASGEKMSLTGFMVIDRNKLKALGGEQLSALAQADELELIYLHLHSMRNFVAVKDKLVASMANGAAGANGANGAHGAVSAPPDAATPAEAAALPATAV